MEDLWRVELRQPVDLGEASLRNVMVLLSGVLNIRAPSVLLQDQSIANMSMSERVSSIQRSLLSFRENGVAFFAN